MQTADSRKHSAKHSTHAQPTVLTKKESEIGSAARKRGKGRLGTLLIFVITTLVVVGYFSRDFWLPEAQQWARSLDLAPANMLPERANDPADQQHAQAHAPGDTGHAHGVGSDNSESNHEAESLYLSEAARKNVGLELTTLALRNFDRTITVPAVITDQPGRTQLEVSAPMTGIVTRIYPLRGEAVLPGQPLFDLRPTHEDLVQAQAQLLQTAEELDVIQREVDRLDAVTASGAIAAKQVLQRRYEQQKLEAALRAQTQALVLHGLSQEQVDGILRDRKLLQKLTINCPEPTGDDRLSSDRVLLMVALLEARQGQHVSAGQRLAMLTDHAELFIEGKAFEQDANALHQAAEQGRPITAMIEGNGQGSHEIPDLTILYVDNEIERDSRALRFYVRLPNELVRDDLATGGRRFVGWRYKPGQRVDLLLPIEQWKECIVLPMDAVVHDGIESFAFLKHGDHFDRRTVHVEFQDQHWAVIGKDGALFPGDVVVASNAYQLHLALKDKATGGEKDPHAGHQH